MRTCRDCHTRRPDSEFNKTRYGLRNECRICQYAQQKVYRGRAGENNKLLRNWRLA